MRSGRFTLLLSILATVAATGLSAQKQQPPAKPSLRSDWARVEEIQPHQKIKVHLTGRKTLKGAFVEASSEGLVLATSGKQTTSVPKSEILRVGRKSRAKGAAIGGIFGGLLGGLIGVAWVSNSRADFTYSGVFKIFGAISGGISAAIGAAVGVESTIYEAAAPVGIAAKPAGR
jgi:hypothetical protein